MPTADHSKAHTKAKAYYKFLIETDWRIEKIQQAGLTEEKEAIKHKILIAVKHYAEGDSKLLDVSNPPKAPKEDPLFNHLNGIDFTMPVQEVEIASYSDLAQFQQDGRMGNYFICFNPHTVQCTADITAFTGALGVSDMVAHSIGLPDFVAVRELAYLQPLQSTKGLISYARSIQDTWSHRGLTIDTPGGLAQIHINDDAKKHIAPVFEVNGQDALELYLQGTDQEKRKAAFQKFCTHANRLAGLATWQPEVALNAVANLARQIQELKHTNQQGEHELIELLIQAVKSGTYSKELKGRQIAGPNYSPPPEDRGKYISIAENLALEEKASRYIDELIAKNEVLKKYLQQPDTPGSMPAPAAIIASPAPPKAQTETKLMPVERKQPGSKPSS